MRSALKEAVSELGEANSGRLLGPLLRHPNKNKIEMKLEVPTPEEREIMNRIKLNDNIIIEVDYE